MRLTAGAVVDRLPTPPEHPQGDHVHEVRGARSGRMALHHTDPPVAPQVHPLQVHVHHGGIGKGGHGGPETRLVRHPPVPEGCPGDRTGIVGHCHSPWLGDRVLRVP